VARYPDRGVIDDSVVVKQPRILREAAIEDRAYLAPRVCPCVSAASSGVAPCAPASRRAAIAVVRHNAPLPLVPSPRSPADGGEAARTRARSLLRVPIRACGRRASQVPLAGRVSQRVHMIRSPFPALNGCREPRGQESYGGCLAWFRVARLLFARRGSSSEPGVLGGEWAARLCRLPVAPADLKTFRRAEQ
jgi:hypothetical protein